MVLALIALLLLTAPAASNDAGSTSRIRAEGAPPVPVTTLTGAEDVIRLCRRLVPAERLRPKGDAVDQGEAEKRHDSERDAAIAGRYELALPADKVRFAPYDGREQRLSVSDSTVLRLSPAALVYATLDRNLPVRVSAALARRILAAQVARRLVLRLVFDLPDDAVCGADGREQRFTIGVEPVEWGWYDGDAALAMGSVASDRPPASLAVGAQAAVDVGQPIAGPSEAQRSVAGRRAELLTCYADGLRRSPALDGVVVVDLGPRVAVSADSTGSAELARCVERVLAPLAGSPPASVPIRFELLAPPTEPEPSPAAESAPAPPPP